MIKAENNGRSKRVTGTSLLEYIDIEYDALVQLFGDPLTGEDTDEYKTDAEWHIHLSDDSSDLDGFVSIYNYKTGQNYLGAKGLPVEKITDWHVGGRNSFDAVILKEYIDINLHTVSPK